MSVPHERADRVPYSFERVGAIMTPEPGNPDEAEGVLNPASALLADGTIRLFPRLVAGGNYSRIGAADLVVPGAEGRAMDVVRRGIVLQPDRSWERGTHHGGTEDARITRIDELGVFVMSYVAFGPTGPRPALAVSRDAIAWRRLGPIQFAYEDDLGVDLNLYPNKDVVFFPEPVPDPTGVMSIAMLHRPMWDLSFVRPDDEVELPAGVEDARASIWISYVPLTEALHDIAALVAPRAHRFVAGPQFDWEKLKIGAGPAPIRVPEGWLLIHHGVSGEMSGSAFSPQTGVRYSVGAMILDAADPSQVLVRDPRALLTPETAEEQDGVVANVVFPTAMEKIDGVMHIFYGMADYRIGVARLIREDDPCDG